jgi:hypothetical protein
MLALYQGAPIVGYGPAQGVARASFAGSASAPVLIDSFGIKSIARTGTGAWTVTLSERLGEFMPFVDVIASDGATVTHALEVVTKDTTTGTFTFVHFTGATRGAAGTASDGVGTTTFQVFVVGRVGL